MWDWTLLSSFVLSFTIWKSMPFCRAEWNLTRIHSVRQQENSGIKYRQKGHRMNLDWNHDNENSVSWSLMSTLIAQVSTMSDLMKSLSDSTRNKCTDLMSSELNTTTIFICESIKHFEIHSVVCIGNSVNVVGYLCCDHFTGLMSSAKEWLHFLFPANWIGQHLWQGPL
jgi:hypothetical protein